MCIQALFKWQKVCQKVFRKHCKSVKLSWDNKTLNWFSITPVITLIKIYVCHGRGSKWWWLHRLGCLCESMNASLKQMRINFHFLRRPGFVCPDNLFIVIPQPNLRNATKSSSKSFPNMFGASLCKSCLLICSLPNLLW